MSHTKKPTIEKIILALLGLLALAALVRTMFLGLEIDEITEGIAEVQASGGERFTVKQLERTRKSLEARLEKLQAEGRKDDVVTFEQLGVDRLFVDEAHNYKNRARRCA